MAKLKVLKVRREEFGQYGAAGLNHFTVACKHRPTDDDLYEAGIYYSRCNCAYDCCGHVGYGAPRVDRRNKRNEWYVTQNWHRCC